MGSVAFSMPGGGPLGELRAALAQVGERDWMAVPEAELHAAVVGFMEAASQLTSVAAAAVREWDSRRAWADDGSKSARMRLAREVRCSKATTGRLCALSRKLGSMPLTSAALSEGKIHADHASRLVVACSEDRGEAFTIAEETLVAIAVEEPNYDDFCRQVEYWEQRADEIIGAAAENHERRHSGRKAHCSRMLDGTWKLDATLDEVGGEEFFTALNRIERELLDADWRDARDEHGDNTNHTHLARTAQQRRADSLVEMARRATAMPVGARKPRPLITVLVGYESLHGPIRETFNGHILPAHAIAGMLTEADVERAVFDPDGRVIEVSKTARFFTGGLRRALEIRDRRCTHPGCDEPAEFCEGDHIIEHCDGGPTTQANGRLHCRTHNHQRPGRRKTPTPAPDDDDHDPYRP